MNTEKTAIYCSTFNPPNLSHFSALTQLLATNDSVVIFPLLDAKTAYYKLAPGYKTRFKLLKNFLSDFFPKLTDRIILVDVKKELDIKTTKFSAINTLNYIYKKLDNNNDIPFILHLENIREENDIILQQHLKYRANYNLEIIHEHDRESENIRAQINCDLNNVKDKKTTNYLISQLGYTNIKALQQKNPYIIKKKELKYSNANLNI